MSTTTPEKFEFQAEIKQLLDIVIHSLYTEKEIFVRELVSNASDALEKLRHLQLTEKSVFDDNLPLEISITTDDTAKTITIQDFGIGMTRSEMIENLGTIAHSGSKAFLKALSEGGEKNDNLIGQFGVGFYSAFMVAESVSVFSHSWKADEPGHVWTSDGSGSYEIEEVEGQRRGTKVVVKLKADCGEFATASRVEGLLKRYSAFVAFPIQLNGTRINTVQALWLRSKNEITDEEYTEFYKFQSHAFDAPRLRLHFSADAPLQINALLFVPESNPEKFGLSRAEPSVALYCRKVLIDAAPKDLLPEWLRFMKGVVDSEDLPLNISRETMQDKALIEKLNKVLTKRFLKLLDEEATSNLDAYLSFYAEFGIFLKEGAALDFSHRDQIMKLLRFESSFTEKGKSTSLTDYVSRMGADQKDIYYLIGANRDAIESGPYLEGLKARNLEVLFCFESVDEYVMNNVRTFDGKNLTSADRSDLELSEIAKPDGEEALTGDDLTALAAWLKESLGDRVEDVKASTRLVDSPVVALSADAFMTPQMRRMMKAMNPEADAPAVKVHLEINPSHPLIRRLATTRTESPEKATMVAEQLLDNALISAGLLEDPTRMLSRIYKLLEQV
ncbi:MAG: molecular chaperone HtpG [Chthoniobacterales bacterium]